MSENKPNGCLNALGWILTIIVALAVFIGLSGMYFGMTSGSIASRAPHDDNPDYSGATAARLERSADAEYCTEDGALELLKGWDCKYNDNGNIVIVGKVRNKGKHAMRFVEIKFKALDKDKNLLEHPSQIQERIEPGETWAFSCMSMHPDEFGTCSFESLEGRE